MNREELDEFFNNCPVLTDVRSGADVDALHDLIKQPGFEVLVGLLFGARQGQYAALANSPLGTAAESCRASVIQGRISGIEMIMQTVVEHVTPEGVSE